MAKAELVYVGTADGLIVLSDPGGIGRWRQVDHAWIGHAITALLARSARDVLVAGAGIGVQHTTDGGQHWQPLLATAVIALTGHPATPTMLYAITAEGVGQRSQDSGHTWEAVPVPATADGACCLLVLPHDPQCLFVAANATVWRSTDAGGAWVQHGAPLPAAITSLVTSPVADGDLLAVAEGAIYQQSSADLPAASTVWHALDLAVGGPGYQVALAVLAGTPTVLLAGFSSRDSLLFARREAREAPYWQMARATVPLQGAIQVITPVSHHMDRAWAGTEGGQLLRTDDRGRTWKLVAQVAAPVHSLAITRLI